MKTIDKVIKKVMKELTSGKLYRKYIRDMKKAGLDPDEPLTLKFQDGHTETTAPLKDLMPHLKPRERTE